MAFEPTAASAIAAWMSMADAALPRPVSQVSDWVYEAPCPQSGCGYPGYRVDFANDHFECPACGSSGDAPDFMVSIGMAASRSEARAALEEVDELSTAHTHRVSDLEAQLSPSSALSLNEVSLHGTPVPLPEFVEGLIGRGELILLSATGGVGKTRLMADLAARLADGDPFLGRPVLSRPRVLFASIDMTDVVAMANILKSFGARPGEGTRLVMPKRNGSSFRLDRKPDVDRLIEDIRASNAGVVMLDTLASAMVGLDERSERDVGIVFEQLKRVRDVTGCTVIVLHHTGHEAHRARGSSALRDNVDRSFMLSSRRRSLTLASDKNRNAAPIRIVFQRIVEGDRMRHVLLDASEGPGNDEPARDLRVEILEHLSNHGPANKTTIERSIGNTRKGIIPAIVDKLLASGELVMVGKFEVGIAGLHDEAVDHAA